MGSLDSSGIITKIEGKAYCDSQSQYIMALKAWGAIVAEVCDRDFFPLDASRSKDFRLKLETEDSFQVHCQLPTSSN